MVLALDTATDAVCTALVDSAGRPLCEVVTHSAGRGARNVLADVDHVLGAAGLGVGELRGIAVGRGPGSFTGVRIGLATAAALADAAGVALAGVSTLDALIHLSPPGTVAVLDARRREVFASGPGIAPAAYKPTDLAGLLAPGLRCAGDGAVRYRDLLEAAGAEIAPDDAPAHVPLARAHAVLARFDGSPVTPIYLREPDATPRPEPARC